jgi:hypothetical protein
MLSAKFSCQPNVPAILAFLFPIRLRPNEEWYEYRSKCSLHGVINGEAVAEVKLVRGRECFTGINAHVFHISRKFYSRMAIFY